MDTRSPHFPLNAWYAAAYDVEVRHALLPRTVCNQKLVLFRRTDGQVAALEDACWHRLLPLSMGRLEGDELVCGYHGLVYNSQGRCTHMPSQETLNPSACVRSFPVAEKHRFIWIWPGDPALADPALVPDMHWNDERLIGESEDEVEWDDVWKPGIEITNSIEAKTEFENFLLDDETGRVTYQTRYRAKLIASFMNLRAFPFDAQVLNISFESGAHAADEAREQRPLQPSGGR